MRAHMRGHSCGGLGTNHTWLLHGFRGSELRLPVLHYKCFHPLSISLALRTFVSSFICIILVLLNANLWANPSWYLEPSLHFFYEYRALNWTLTAKGRKGRERQLSLWWTTLAFVCLQWWLTWIHGGDFNAIFLPMWQNLKVELFSILLKSTKAVPRCFKIPFPQSTRYTPAYPHYPQLYLSNDHRNCQLWSSAPWWSCSARFESSEAALWSLCPHHYPSKELGKRPPHIMHLQPSARALLVLLRNLELRKCPSRRNISGNLQHPHTTKTARRHCK